MGILFDEFERTLEDSRKTGMSVYEYTNLSNRPEAERVRTFVETCLEKYPDPQRSELVGRLKSANPIAYKGAEFELLLHELLIRAGHEVELPPIGSAIEKQPDFLVRTASGEAFWLEATIAGLNLKKVGDGRRTDDLFDAIDGVDSEDFDLWVEVEGVPTQQVSAKAVKQKVEQWLAGLSYEAILAGDGGEHLLLREADCEIEVIPLPRKQQDRGKDTGGAIAARTEGGWSSTKEHVRTAFERKRKRYGDLEEPFVVAINALSLGAGYDDFEDALFGGKAAQLILTPDGKKKAYSTRLPDGMFGTLDKPGNAQVSGVLAARNLGFWEIGQRDLNLILNPWASVALGDTPLECKMTSVGDGRFVREEGKPVYELLDLYNGWPE
ncbi:hypothetical protein [Parvibaculum indicum]|uniref:hypothetical protein n=1 Tax=Parvibaculum indicum TaxID=562969 RepID=UPI001423E705|nr:hypothetical protein [Parvibaculum indicum]